MRTKEDLIKLYDDVLSRFNPDEMDKRELLNLKSDANSLKSEMYIYMDEFDSKAECFFYINNLNSLIEKIVFEMDYHYKLLNKIRNMAVIEMGDGWSDFIRRCKDSL